MKFVTAFDSFKGCMSATESCHAAAEALKQKWPEAEVVEIPLSDGGEGLVQSLSEMDHGLQKVTFPAHSPLMEDIETTYALSPYHKTAYMEMAATSGLPLVPLDKRNPMLTTTYGVGDMIADALDQGCSEIVMGIGGSATNDGGKGMIQSLMDKGMLNAQGKMTDERLKMCRFRVACDVNNPLCGPNGASYVFGPQKGASPEQVKELDAMLHDFADQTVSLGIASPALADHPGTGAAGGLGYGLMAYLGAELLSGIDIILDIVHFDERIKGADIIFTGEGKSDRQTLMGKVPQGVLHRAERQHIPVYLFSGAIEEPELLSSHFALVQSINAGDERPLSILMKPEVAKRNLYKMVFSSVNIL